MLRAFWFLIKLCLLLGVIVWLLERPGNIKIEWLGYIIETSVGVAVACLIALIALWTFAYRLWRAFVSVPAVYRRYQISARREKGYRAVTSGLVAIAAGDALAAEKYTKRAKDMIPDAPLAKLLSAQSAQMNGNAPKARREFTALLDDEDAAFFGLRGLLNEHMRDRNYGEAANLLARAENLQPKRLWIVRNLFDLETRGRNWKKAVTALKKAESLRLFDAATARRHRQALFTAEGDAAMMLHDMKAAENLYARAFALDPAFTPSALRLAKIYAAEDKRRPLLKTLERAWAAQPHPDLAHLWRKAAPLPKKKANAYDAGRAGYAWMTQLTEHAPDHRDSHRALGQAALDSRLWPEARRHLTLAADYRALARLEQEENRNDAKAREWLELAADHPPENKWACTSCGHAGSEWAPLCPDCGVFNTQEWMIPESGIQAQDSALRFSSDLIGPPLRVE
jgi:HemY protein